MPLKGSAEVKRQNQRWCDRDAEGHKHIGTRERLDT